MSRFEGHTPGPWEKNDELRTTINAGKKHIAMVNLSHRGLESDVFDDEHTANAELIAAAPSNVVRHGTVSYTHLTLPTNREV